MKNSKILKFIPFISLAILCLIKVSSINWLLDNYLTIAIALSLISGCSLLLLKFQIKAHTKVVFGVSIIGVGIILISQLLKP